MQLKYHWCVCVCVCTCLCYIVCVTKCPHKEHLISSDYRRFDCTDTI